MSEAYNITMNILFDFWGKVTPCVLQLVQQSKMVNQLEKQYITKFLPSLIIVKRDRESSFSEYVGSIIGMPFNISR